MAIYTRTDKFGASKAFRSVHWGAQSKVLDTELTELQKILTNQTNMLTKRLLNDGFMTKGALTYAAATGGTLTVPMDTLVVDGYTVLLEDNMVITGVATATVYLAMWEQEVAYGDTVYRAGNLSGGQVIADNGILDAEIGVETSRRSQTQVQLVTSNADATKKYIPVASIAAGVVTDNRSYASLKVPTTIDGRYNMGLGIAPTYGFHQLGGGHRLQALATPTAPTVTPTGAVGSTSYTYFVVATDRRGNKTLASTGTTTATGNATLTATNYNAISWTVVPGAVSYDVLKTNTATSLALGVTGTSINDTGQATAAYTAPTRNTTADMLVDGVISIPPSIATLESKLLILADSDYAIGMGPGSGEGYVNYYSGSQSISSFGHRFKVNSVERFKIQGDGLVKTTNNTIDDGTGIMRIRDTIGLGDDGTHNDATLHIKDVKGGNGRLTQMSPKGANSNALNIIASKNASNVDQWWSWGVANDNTFRINSGTDLSTNGLTIDSAGKVATKNNTLDDGAGRQTIVGDIVLQTPQSGASSNSKGILLNAWNGTAGVGARLFAASGGGWFSTNWANSLVTMQVTDVGDTTIAGALTVNGAGGSFASSKAANGYQKLPGGLIIQWGQVACAGNTTTGVISFPIAFPTAWLSMIATSNMNGQSANLSGVTTTTYNLYHSGAGAGTLWWIAIGY